MTKTNFDATTATQIAVAEVKRQQKEKESLEETRKRLITEKLSSQTTDSALEKILVDIEKSAKGGARTTYFFYKYEYSSWLPYELEKDEKLKKAIGESVAFGVFRGYMERLASDLSNKGFVVTSKLTHHDAHDDELGYSPASTSFDIEVGW